MRIRPSWTIGWGLALALLLMTTLALSEASAAGPGAVRDKFRSGNTVVIPAGETVPHDLYVAGGTVRVAGRIEGDLFVAGGTVDISGPVTGDVFAAGGTVTASAAVGRHLRVAGGNVIVGGPVQLDVLGAAGTMALQSGARVGGDLIFSVGQMNLDGVVAGGVLGSAQTYEKTGSVGGTEDVTLNQPQPKQRPAQTVGGRLLDEFQRYAGIVLVGGLLLWLAPRFMRVVVTRLRERPLLSFGTGALGLIGFIPILLAVIIVTVLLAIPLGMLGLSRLVMALVFGVTLGSAALSYLAALVLLFVAAVVVGLTLGELAGERMNQPWARRPYVALLVGAFIVVALTAIPVIGWVLNVIGVLFGLGALLWRCWQLRGVLAARSAGAETGASQ